MSANKHNLENEGAKPKDHDHPRHHFWRHAHQDWRVWAAVMLMLVLIMAYVVTNDFSTGSGKKAAQPTPEANLP